VGDKVYGGRPRLPKQPSERLRICLQRFPRQALHATALSFAHPMTGETLQLHSPPPDDLEALLEALRADTRGDEA
jgi:23S rRNA pseudouridine1911/1915/1917 synthase